MVILSLHSESHCKAIVTTHICGKVMFPSCLSICVCVWALTLECLDRETLFLVWWYIWMISKFKYKGHGVKATLDAKGQNPQLPC